MTLDEARTIARIIGRADNGDPVTVGNLVDAFNDALPAYVWNETGEIEYDDEQTAVGLIVSVLKQ